MDAEVDPLQGVVAAEGPALWLRTSKPAWTPTKTTLTLEIDGAAAVDVEAGDVAERAADVGVDLRLDEAAEAEVGADARAGRGSRRFRSSR